MGSVEMCASDALNLLSMFDTQGVGVAVFSKEGQYLYSNNKELELRGLLEKPASSFRVFSLFNEQQAETLTSVFAEALKDKRKNIQFYYEKDQRSFEMMISADQHDNITSILIEKTHEQALKNQLRENEENLKRLDDAIQGANIGCWDFFPQEERIIANKTWVTQKGYADELFREDTSVLFSDVIDGLDKWSTLVHPNDRAATINIIQSHLDGETEYYDAKFRMKFGDGKWHWIHDVGKVFLRDDQGIAIRMNGVHIDITAEKEMEFQIQKLLHQDELTGVKNRRSFDIEFPKLLCESFRGQNIIAFILMDVDHFKEYNDTYGHKAGDLVLREIGSLLNRSLQREDDACFRLGGEEFAVLYKVDTKDDAIEYAENLRAGIESLKIHHMKNPVHKFLTVSLGLFYERSLGSVDVDRIFKKTDKLLYEAKNAGKNCIVSCKGLVPKK